MPCTVHGAFVRSSVSRSVPWLVFRSRSTVPLLGVFFGSGGSGTGRAAGSSGVSVYLHGPGVTLGGRGAGSAAADAGPAATRTVPAAMVAAAATRARAEVGVGTHGVEPMAVYASTRPGIETLDGAI